jgi:hypothetical protein
MIGRLLGIGPVLATAAGAVSAQSLTQAFVEAYRTNPQISAVRDLNRATSPTTSGGVIGILSPIRNHDSNMLDLIDGSAFEVNDE